jgi:dUTP pyrophosphatase
MPTLKFWRVHTDVQLPKHQTDGSACFDLAFQGHGKGNVKGFTRMNKPIERVMRGSITVSPGDRMLIPTGLVMDIPHGYSVRLHARSGTSLKQGLVLANAEGVIDSDYVEEVFILLYNMSENAHTINFGDRIAQAELVKNEEYDIEETATRPSVKSSRAGGMGSTGVSESGNLLTITVPDEDIMVESFQPVEKRGRGRPKKNAGSIS